MEERLLRNNLSLLLFLYSDFKLYINKINEGMLINEI